jgi:hypothetical protein
MSMGYQWDILKWDFKIGITHIYRVNIGCPMMIGTHMSICSLWFISGSTV